MRVGVYAIAKNEYKNLDGWFANIQNADHILILDTGSTDGTPEKAKSLGIEVFESKLVPWDEARARNIAMSLMPSDIDYCVSIDLDEHISSIAWLDAVRSITDHDIYSYYSSSTNGSADILRPIRAIHPRFGYFWDGFRPTLRPYPGFGVANPANSVLDFTTIFISGDQDRYDDRDPLYLSSYKMHYEMLINRSSEMKRKLFETQAYLALSYFEIEDYNSFLNTAISVSNDARTLDPEYAKELGMLVDFAIALISPEKSREVFSFWKKEYHDKKTVLYREMMFAIISKDLGLLSTCYQEFVSASYETDSSNVVVLGGSDEANIMRIAQKVLFGEGLNSEEVRILIEAYASFGWGKKQIELARDLANKYWQL